MIVNVLLDDIAGFQESVTEIVNELVTEAARTVPLMTPVVSLRLRPAGSAPETRRQRYGAAPPLAVKAARYVPAIVAVIRESVITCTGFGETLNVAFVAAVSGGDEESLTLTAS